VTVDAPFNRFVEVLAIRTVYVPAEAVESHDELISALVALFVRVALSAMVRARMARVRRRVLVKGDRTGAASEHA